MQTINTEPRAKTLDDLVAAISSILASTQRCPDRVKSYFQAKQFRYASCRVICLFGILVVAQIQGDTVKTLDFGVVVLFLNLSNSKIDRSRIDQRMGDWYGNLESGLVVSGQAAPHRHIRAPSPAVSCFAIT